MKKFNHTPPSVIVHWPSMGPYHMARLRAVKEYFDRQDLHLTALELYGSDKEYLWARMDQHTGLERHTLFPYESMADVSKIDLFRTIWNYLERAQPLVIAINGYSSWDSWTLLAWCRLKGRIPILMSDSKMDDAPRKTLVEAVKRSLVSLYGSALCAGTPHKEYLEKLGMPPHVIFDGYDAVDNQFFIDRSDIARKFPDNHRSLAGLEDDGPFFLASGRFIPRKNFRGLIRAFAIYRQTCLQNGQIPWQLVILGDGPERDAMADEIKIQHLETVIVLAGAHTLDNLPAYYGLSSVFIHPPLQDQWGLVVNEAMASGLPVLVSERAGCAYDLIEDGMEGFKFDPEDLQGLASLMIQMSSGVLDLNRMGSAAREKISNWGVERFAHSLLQAVRVGLNR